MINITSIKCERKALLISAELLVPATLFHFSPMSFKTACVLFWFLNRCNDVIKLHVCHSFDSHALNCHYFFCHGIIFKKNWKYKKSLYIVNTLFGGN